MILENWTEICDIALKDKCFDNRYNDEFMDHSLFCSLTWYVQGLVMSGWGGGRGMTTWEGVRGKGSQNFGEGDYS